MSENRKDSKGRVLRSNEYQKKDGRYEYRFIEDGKKHSVYSWRLTDSDPTPKGKHQQPSLRSMEKEINKRLLWNHKIIPSEDITFDHLFSLLMKQKSGFLKNSTLSSYRQMYNTHMSKWLQNHSVSKMNSGDVKEFFSYLRIEDHMGVGSLGVVSSILNMLFKVAIDEQIIQYNPALGALSSIAKGYTTIYSSASAMTEEQENRFVNFVKEHRYYRRYSNLFVVMLGTGMRISEMSALQWEDIDFVNNIIHVTHNYISYKDPETGKRIPEITTPKTQSSIRDIPMLSDVREALLAQQESQLNSSQRFELSGYDNFVFLGRSGRIIKNMAVNTALKQIVNQYNELEETKAIEEQRLPVFLPKLTSHSMRHTFATRLNEKNIDLKVRQKVLGHSKINITMDVYTSTNMARIVSQFDDLDNSR